uniref:Cytochrome P450 n=1 Tax=Liposcelis entomophila TaxID=550478 RepID=A0A0U3YU82_9NEOP|nr:cytochrome P450 [Liposcelis entomophila]
MLLIWVAAIAIAFLYIYNNKKNKHVYECAKKFPGPKAYPIFGNSLDFATNSNGIFKKIQQFTNQYDRFFRIWNNGRLFLFCKDYQDAEVLLSNNVNITKSDQYRFTLPWIGQGLINATGSRWRAHRKIITPTFHFKILQEFLDVFNRNGLIMCEKLAAHAGKGPIDVFPYLNLLALDNICETAMGINMNIQKNSETTYVKAVKTMCKIISMRMFKVWLMPDLLFKMSKYYKMQQDALKILHGTTEKVIKQRRQELREKKDGNKKTEDDFYERKKLGFLDLLIQSEEGSKLTDREVREQVDTFMFAGHDTISSALSFSLYCLAHNPELQEKAYQEQLSIFGDSDRLPTFADIQEMKYLEKVVKEAQRLFPSIPLIGRLISEDLELPGGYLVPKGAEIILLTWGLHRDPRVWKNPEQFDPENFSPDAIQVRNPYSYVPFSAGSRNCIGQKYAMLELKATVAKVLRKFKILPSPYEKDQIELAAEVVMISTTGINLCIESRS